MVHGSAFVVILDGSAGETYRTNAPAQGSYECRKEISGSLKETVHSKRMQSMTNVVPENREMHLEKLKCEVERLYQCSASHFESVMVEEIARGRTLWKGDIEIFKLRNHPDAEWSYVWSYQDGGEEKFAALLQIPPIISPSTAVRSVFGKTSPA